MTGSASDWAPILGVIDGLLADYLTMAEPAILVVWYMFTFGLIASLINKWTEPLRRAFMSAFDLIRSRISIGTLTSDIARSDIESAIQEVGLSESAFRPMENVLQQSF